MGILFSYHDDGTGDPDWEATTRNGRHKVTQGRKGGVDYTKHSSGCSLALVAAVGAAASVAPAIAQAVHDSVRPWL